MRRAVVVLLGVGLGCAGVATPPPVVEPVQPPVPAPVEPAEPAPAEPAPAEPEPEPEEAGDDDPAWIASAVARGIEAEIQPGTSGDESDEHREEIRAFFLAHPEYADPAALDRLLEDACDVGLPDAHERLVHPTPKTPAVVEVAGDDWRTVVTYTRWHCTSDDWGWYTAEVGQQLAALHVPNGYASADNDMIVVQRDGKEIARLSIPEGSGYLALRAGHDPIDVGHSMTDAVMADLRAALELP